MMKLCSKCKRERDVTYFNKDRTRKDGLHPTCTPCRCGLDELKPKPAPMYASHAEKVRVWRSKNPERYRASMKKRDAEKARASQREWRARNKESQRQRTKLWAKENPAICALHSANRRAAKKMAIPSWANRFFISEIYELASLRTEMLGVRHVVDHIVPLQSKKVCGLHVEHNLQVIPESINAAKSNVWWPNMPGVE